jgi:hypothetical protein
MVEQKAKAPQRRQRLVPRSWPKLPAAVEPGAEPGKDLFVEDRSRDARRPGIDDEADRVRPDVDNRRGFGRFQA